MTNHIGFETRRTGPSTLARTALAVPGRPDRVFQLTRFGWANHTLLQEHIAKILNEIAPFIMANQGRIGKIEVVGFSSGTRRHIYHAEQRAINAKKALTAILRDKFGADSGLLAKVELAAAHRPLPVGSASASDPEHRKVAFLIFFDGSSLEISGPDELEIVTTTVPTPGRFYKIQYGAGGLLTTVGKAYSVGSGSERLQLAQRVNGHPLNRAFWAAPESAFNKKYFPQGIISFNPVFTCDSVQQRAGKGEKKCFARIYIPPRYAAIDPVYGRMISMPLRRETSEKELAGRAKTEPGLRRFLTFTECLKLQLSYDSFKTIFKRKLVDDTSRAPYKWVAGLVCIFEHLKEKDTVFVPPMEGTAFFVSEKYMLTAAHNLLKKVRYEDGSEHLQKPIFALITPGRNGIDADAFRALWEPPNEEAKARAEAYIEARVKALCQGTDGEASIGELFPDPDARPDARPFGDIWVERRDDSTFRTAPDFAAPTGPLAMNIPNDFGLIRLAGASIFGSRPKGFWGKEPGEADGEPELETKVVFSDEKYPTSNIKLIGYPGDKCCEQWEAQGDMIGSAGDTLTLASIKAPPGNSGGPVFTEEIVDQVTSAGKKKVKLLRVIGILVSSESTLDRKMFSGRATAVRTGLRMKRVLQGWFASDAKK